jgi:hypothetical protein
LSAVNYQLSAYQIFNSIRVQLILVSWLANSSIFLDFAEAPFARDANFAKVGIS